LEKGLRGIWGNENVGVYELLPLRQIDVEEAAKSYGFDSEKFLVVALVYLGYTLYKQSQLKETAPSAPKNQIQVNVAATEQTKEANMLSLQNRLLKINKIKQNSDI